jgi:hypothetical protein
MTSALQEPVQFLCSLMMPRTFSQGDNSALHWAAMRGHVEVVRALVAAGADKTACNKQGCTPIDLCEPQVGARLAWPLLFNRRSLCSEGLHSCSG